MRSRWFSTGLGLGLVVVLGGGCGGPKNVVPVTGKIAFADGTPLPAGTRVMFNPADGAAGAASGTLAADGSFKLRHVRGGDGAEPGSYTVSLLAPESDSAKELYKMMYKDYYDGSVLAVEVKPGMGPVEFKIPKKTSRR